MTTIIEQTEQTSNAPAPIGEILKELRSIRDQRDELSRCDSKLSEREAELKGHLLKFHEHTGLLNLADHGLSVTFTPGKLRIGYLPEHWDAMQKWLVEHGYGYCILRRLNEAKMRELIDNGVSMPEGVKVEPYTDISIRRK